MIVCKRMIAYGRKIDLKVTPVLIDVEHATELLSYRALKAVAT